MWIKRFGSSQLQEIGIKPTEAKFAQRLKREMFLKVKEGKLKNTEDLENQKHSTEKEKIKKLNISSKKLKGHLDFNEFVNLEELDCSENELVSLEFSRCNNLQRLRCSDNQLNELDLRKCGKLEFLD
ncbi:33409_t:CDS:2, partial [Racocetra persica]